MNKTRIDLTVTKTPDYDSAYTGSSEVGGPSSISVSTDKPDEIARLLQLAGINLGGNASPVQASPETPCTDVVCAEPEHKEEIVEPEMDGEVEHDVEFEEPEEETISAVIPLCDKEMSCAEGLGLSVIGRAAGEALAGPVGAAVGGAIGASVGNDKDEVDEAEGCPSGAPEENELEEGIISRLSWLSNIKKATVKEARLIEVHNSNEKVLNMLRRLGKTMVDFHRLGEKLIDKASEPLGSYNSDFEGEEADQNFKRLNKMSRIGKMLQELGEPGSKPLARFDREDLEFIADELDLTPEKFATVAKIDEASVTLRPYQGTNNVSPMSKRVGNSDQALINKTGDNPVDDKTAPRAVATRTIRESLDAIAGVNKNFKVIKEESEYTSPNDLEVGKKYTITRPSGDFSGDINVLGKGVRGGYPVVEVKFTDDGYIDVYAPRELEGLGLVETDFSHDTEDFYGEGLNSEDDNIITEMSSEVKYLAQAIADLPESKTFDEIISLLRLDNESDADVSEENIRNALLHIDNHRFIRIKHLLKAEVIESIKENNLSGNYQPSSGIAPRNVMAHIGHKPKSDAEKAKDWYAREEEEMRLFRQKRKARQEEVEEGNSHDDLRAKKSDHDTLMRKNIADAKAEHIVDEAAVRSAAITAVARESEELDEKAPPSKELEHWIKKNKAHFKKEYGDKKGE